MHATMVKYDLSEEIKKLKDEWRSALEENGEQCVTIYGIQMMPKWCADSWVTCPTSVHVCHNVLIHCLDVLYSSQIASFECFLPSEGRPPSSLSQQSGQCG